MCLVRIYSVGLLPLLFKLLAPLYDNIICFMYDFDLYIIHNMSLQMYMNTMFEFH